MPNYLTAILSSGSSSRRIIFSLAAAAASSALCLPIAVLAQGQSVSGTLVLYSSQPERDLKETLAAFNQQYPNVKVETYRSGTTEVINRLRTEIAAGAPKPDLLLIADAVSMEALKAEGRLMRMRNIDTSGIPAAFFDEQRTYIGTKLITTGIVYNTKAAFKPTSWADLQNPALKGQVVMPSPLYSGAAAITVGAWASAPDLGWKYIEGLKANNAVAVRGNGAVLQQVASGEKMAGVLVDFMALSARAKGSPVEFVIPKEGLTFVTEPVAILNTAKNVPAAEAFVNFLISSKGQEFSTSLGYVPLAPNVAPPKGYPAGASYKFMKVAPANMVRTGEDEKKRFGQVFGG
jgi:iron(III) transport system substrate-binding protein